MLGLVIVFVVLGIIILGLAGVVAIAKGSEVLNEYIRKGN